MGDTVSNQNRVIATQGSGHKPMTAGATDVCMMPGKPETAAPFSNNIASDPHLHGGTNSQRTTIGQDKIWVDGGRVGTPGAGPSSPDHPPQTMGVATGTPYKREAWNTSASGDLYVEGRGVVRSSDTTMQNGGNTTGQTDGSNLSVEKEQDAEFFENACKLVKLEGTTTGDEPVSLGKRSPNSAVDDYLHIHESEEVEFTVERVDTTSGSAAPAGVCALRPEHTIWRARRTGGNRDPMVKAEDSTDTFTVDTSLTDFGVDGIVDIKAGVLEVDWAAIVRLWRFEKYPTKIAVSATSCSGVKTAEIELKPKKGPYTFTFEFENENPSGPSPNKTKLSDNNTFRALMIAIAILKPGLQILEKVATLSSNIRYQCVFLEKSKIVLGISYERCTKSGSRWGVSYTPAHIRRVYQLDLSFAPLIKFLIEGNIALVDVVQAWAPGIGTWVSKFLKKIKASGVRADLGVKLELTIGGQFGLDQHMEFLGSATSVYATFAITFYLRVTLELAVAEAWVLAEVKGSVRFFLAPPKEAGALASAGYQGKVEFEVEFGGKAWIFEAKKKFKVWEFAPDPKEYQLPPPG